VAEQDGELSIRLAAWLSEGKHQRGIECLPPKGGHGWRIWLLQGRPPATVNAVEAPAFAEALAGSLKWAEERTE
jgi:hypothetical protein